MENSFLFIANIGIPELLLLLLMVGIPGILWIWSLVDLLTSKFANSLEKLIWLIAIVFVPVLGAVLYLLIGRKQKIKPVSA
ncbi:PLD nuclease N-terminal domain-containing protein [Rufibacter sediminis]|uniref:PLDc_N domain-containing protein n=1 Tax=Rufibacter sediminis TaxID=2762756 RepID=A0ABR6VQN4_9BACT|nr:PLD nuclease N-terminal domain-containing protein [Rufibacter sediminis]MBC3539456.1 PLDc_N domain-containing protein [Rufibacter sediminis]